MSIRKEMSCDGLVIRISAGVIRRPINKIEKKIAMRTLNISCLRLKDKNKKGFSIFC
jgi:hypothetical protein|tara:strand:- start:2505 stop:2675 length:171 start_codon:yes stop_codon:yes gene_type:complete